MNSTMQKYGFTNGVEYDMTRTTIWVSALMEPTERISLRIDSDIISKLTVNHAYFDVVIGESGVSG